MSFHSPFSEESGDKMPNHVCQQPHKKGVSTSLLMKKLKELKQVKVCQKCGTKLPENSKAKNCPYCGGTLVTRYICKHYKPRKK